MADAAYGLWPLVILNTGLFVLSLADRCVVGIEADRQRCRDYVERSTGLVTALSPIIGYDRAATIAVEATDTGDSVYNLVLAKGWLTRHDLDTLLRPETMIQPACHG